MDLLTCMQPQNFSSHVARPWLTSSRLTTGTTSPGKLQEPERRWDFYGILGDMAFRRYCKFGRFVVNFLAQLLDPVAFFPAITNYN